MNVHPTAIIDPLATVDQTRPHNPMRFSPTPDIDCWISFPKNPSGAYLEIRIARGALRERRNAKAMDSPTQD
jgi:hypothetical protein